MKKFIIGIMVLCLASSLYAMVSPKILIDKASGRVKTWGYTNFDPKPDEAVIDNVYLKQGEDVSDGLRYVDGRIIRDPSCRIIPPKNELEELSDKVSQLQFDVNILKGK